VKNLSSKLNFHDLFHITKADIDWVENKINKMSVEDKCAQLIFSGIKKIDLNENSKELKKALKAVQEIKVGGIVLFEGKIEEYVELINKLQEAVEISLLFAADFERGLGSRLYNALEFPYAAAVAATGNPNFAYLMSKSTAIQAKALGIFQNYAPIADINNNPGNLIINARSFSDDKNIVTRYVNEFIRGTNEIGILSTIKHFPGHGGTFIDSHLDIPKIISDKKNLLKNELSPFIEAILAGAKSVMVGHLEANAIDKLPASLSKSIIKNLLIKELGFEGLVVTDALDMYAITKYFPVKEAVVYAVKAGADAILVPADDELAANSLVTAVKNNEIKIERIERSLKKLLLIKKSLHLETRSKLDINSVRKVVNGKSHRRLVNEIAEKSITLLRNRAQIIPLDPANYYKVLSINISDDIIEEKHEFFNEQLKSKFRYVKSIFINDKSEERDYLEILNEAENSELIIISVFIKVKPGKGQIDFSQKDLMLLNEINKLSKSSIVIIFGNPYLISSIPDRASIVCAYGDPIASQNAALRSLFGEIDIVGKLPLSIPETNFKLGGGIKLSKSKLIYDNEENDKYYDFSKIKSLMESSINEKIFPGAALLIAKEGKIIFNENFGSFTFDNSSEKVSQKTLFDIDSLTQLFTLYAILLLIDYNHVHIEEKIGTYLTDFPGRQISSIKLRNLLDENFKINLEENINADYSINIVDKIARDNIKTDREDSEIQNEIKMLIFQSIIEALSYKGLDAFLVENILTPLNLKNTIFNPSYELSSRCLPTSSKLDIEKPGQGVVYNENSFKMGGVSGFAGLFSTPTDLAVIIQTFFQNGAYNSFRLIRNSIFENFFPFKKPVLRFLGKTGVSLFVDKNEKIFYILLSNSVYGCDDKEAFKKFNEKLETEVYSLIKYDF
jgi:beta-glucosidase-like glycosyl hydrolase